MSTPVRSTLLILALAVLFAPLRAQETTVISGFIRDRANGESLPFANVRIVELKIGSSANNEGYYAITKVPRGTYTLQITLMGYRTTTISVDTRQGEALTKHIQMTAEAVQSNEVVVSADRHEEATATQTGRVVLKALDVTNIPSVGEADVFRALQVMPGVKAISEISSGLYVRGGSPDQNLILLDGTVVYNPSHLFGFFSTFNNDAIKDVELMKGGFPAEFGGRLSSVLNVTNVDGDRVSTHGKGSVSLISSRLTGEGPLGNGSWFISGRRTYFDQLVKAAGLDKGKDAIPLYYFYDANGKLNQDFGENDRVSIVGYLGQDNMDFSTGRGDITLNMGWGNRTISGKWTHVFAPTVFSNFNATYSRYVARTNATFGGVQFHQENTINDASLKGDINFYPANDHLVKLGFWGSQYTITYAERMGDGDTYEFTERPWQFSLYGQDEWTVSPLLRLQGGIRMEYQNLTKSTTWSPRFSARYFLQENLAVKFATGLYYQYLNAIQVGEQGGFSPFDVWVPLNDKMNPGKSLDFVLGIECEPIDRHNLTVETYYKEYWSLLHWIGQPTRTKDISQLFYTGDGRAYGIEMFLQRRYGALTGSIGYTLAWTYRHFPQLNGGREFMPKFDRRHDLSVTGTYQLGETWKLGAVFTYSTGQSYTMGTARYAVRTPEGELRHILPGDLYNYRLPPYHRLDVSLTHTITLFGANASWYLQVYNVYNRKNVWFRHFDMEKNPTEVTDITLLPIIPTFGLDFEL